MKSAIMDLIEDEKGRVLIGTLVLLVLGSLILTPLLSLMGTGLMSGQVYESRMNDYYAADAGVEDAIWHLLHGGDPDDVLELTSNNRDVVVTMEHINADICYEKAIYEIISTAASEDGPRKTIRAHVTGIEAYYVVNYGDETIEFNIEVEGPLDLDSGEEVSGNVMAGGTVELHGDASIAGSLIAEDDVILNEDATSWGVLITGGDLILNEAATIWGTVCVGGHIIMNTASSIMGDVFVEEYLALVAGKHQACLIGGDVYARGIATIDMKKVSPDLSVLVGGCSEITGSVWSGAKLETAMPESTIIGNVHVNNLADVTGPGTTGTVYADYDDNWACQLGLMLGDFKILSWEIT